jgi:hypothetical protein
MPIYVAFALCFAAAKGEHCVMRSWWKPLYEGHHAYSSCVIAERQLQGRWRPDPSRWRAENLICSWAPLPYPPVMSGIPPYRYG